MEEYSGNEVFNIGTGKDHTIAELAILIKKIVGYSGNIVYDISKPEGVLVKLQDISKMTRLGWNNHVSLEKGVQRTYDSYLGAHHSKTP